MGIFRTILILAGLMVAAAAQAEGPAPFPDFDAKRIKPPTAGSSKRITVQIEERANPAVPPVGVPGAVAQPTEESAAAPEGAVSLYDWFWDAVAPATEAIGPGRLDDAMRAIQSDAGRGALQPPRLQAMQDLARSYGTDLLIGSVGTEVSPALALAVLYVESGGNAAAVSPAGAQGVMQLMPATAIRFGVMDAFDARDNIKGGIAFLDSLMRRYNGDPILTLAAYNAGEGAVATHTGVPPFAETRNYVPRVLSAYGVARGLCITPPLLASDGCVFAGLNH
ncbi:lytic transglycosylase domain-containing protein [Cognatishimia sp. SS12]|uniref:lytic transglycosylase domain-containing protein n=1 Tax=Cognatishimia sp. SS12 TaxID=2979465 RepID=UPI00232AD7B0|nr:lytic transglycosylase domain-containing protein [Cognatishimia sp. SS12]MDC0738213.1 lytic transglycosylase domain-containing protein [Cognatishimia sp. SS12]